MHEMYTHICIYIRTHTTTLTHTYAYASHGSRWGAVSNVHECECIHTHTPTQTHIYMDVIDKDARLIFPYTWNVYIYICIYM